MTKINEYYLASTFRFSTNMARTLVPPTKQLSVEEMSFFSPKLWANFVRSFTKLCHLLSQAQSVTLQARMILKPFEPHSSVILCHRLRSFPAAVALLYHITQWLLLPSAGSQHLTRQGVQSRLGNKALTTKTLNEHIQLRWSTSYRRSTSQFLLK